MSPTHIALLRGINVGGHNRVPMAELRSLFEGLGHEHVATYVQSGNVVFDSAAGQPAIVSAIEQTIAAQFGFAVPVVVRSRSELAAVATRHPLAGDEPDEEKLHVFFLADAPPAAIPGLDPARYAPDEFVLDRRELYVHYPNGQGRSKLTVAQVERAFETTATARNWRTIARLLQLADGAERRKPDVAGHRPACAREPSTAASCGRYLAAASEYSQR